MNPLPLPVRLAAGLVATAVEQARELPRLVVEFPVTAVSQALQVSMRVQQKVTELAIKGDRALGTLRPVEERPSWATFDEELPRNGVSTVTELRPPARTESAVDVAARTTARAAESPEEPATLPEPEPAPDLAVATAARATADAAERESPPVVGSVDPDRGPNALPTYPQLSIPQLRGRLRFLSRADLEALLVWETNHDNRAPYVTMLTNRIASVSEG